MTPKRSPYYTDPKEYFGTYVGRRIDGQGSGLADSTEELIGSSRLTIDDGDVTYSMTHERIEFSGTYQYRVDSRVGKDGEKERFRVMELYVYDVVGFRGADLAGGDIDFAANKAAGREPSSPERLKLYEDILHGISWRFELLDDGYRQLDSDFGPGIYEFHRQRSGGGGGAPADVGTDDAEDSDSADSQESNGSGGPRIAGVSG